MKIGQWKEGYWEEVIYKHGRQQGAIRRTPHAPGMDDPWVSLRFLPPVWLLHDEARSARRWAQWVRLVPVMVPMVTLVLKASKGERREAENPHALDYTEAVEIWKAQTNDLHPSLQPLLRLDAIRKFSELEGDEFLSALVDELAKIKP